MIIDLITNVFFAALLVGTVGSILSVLGPPIQARQKAVRSGMEEFRGRRGIH